MFIKKKQILNFSQDLVVLRIFRDFDSLRNFYVLAFNTFQIIVRRKKYQNKGTRKNNEKRCIEKGRKDKVPIMM